MSTFNTGATKYGQVEPNRLSGITYGVIEAQAPAFSSATPDPEDIPATAIPILENGQFLCVIPDTVGVSPLGRIAVLPGVAPATAVPMLVFNETELYDERLSYGDYAQGAEIPYVDGVLYPRLVGLTPDTDVFTTNTLNVTAPTDVTDPTTSALTLGQILYIGNDGYLTTAKGTNTVYEFHVIKKYTMPGGKYVGIKLQSAHQV
jgi:hypothetical protein